MLHLDIPVRDQGGDEYATGSQCAVQQIYAVMQAGYVVIIKHLPGNDQIEISFGGKLLTGSDTKAFG